MFLAYDSIRDGNDGKWSSFAVQIGSPPQVIRVLPSTSGSSLWAVLPEECTKFDPSTCADDRGGAFNPNISTSWVEKGLFQLPDYSEQAALPSIYNVNSSWGLDNITLDWPANGGLSLEKQVTAAYAAKDFYIGSLGLSPYPTNVTYTEEYPSLLSTLRSRSFIPSLSYGYTAGAIYKQRPTFGSLTFGGYDAGRSGPQNLTVPISADQDLNLIISINDITSGNNSLLSSPILALIDSTVSQIWLPLSACAKLESIYGLNYDPTLQLFLVDDTTHQTLINSNAGLSFRLSSGTSNSNATLDIVLPYASLDLVAGFPLDGNATRRYYPVRCANETVTKYVLGRTFLQEAYLTVDYERSTFAVSQALFPDPGVGSNLVPIYVPNATIVPQTPALAPSTLTAGAIAGIVVGALALIVFVGAYFLIRHRNRQQAKSRKAVPITIGELSDTKDIKQEGQSVAYIGQKAELDTEDTKFKGHEIGGEEVNHNEVKPSPVSPTSSGRGATSPSLRFSMWRRSGSGHRQSLSGGISSIDRTSPIYEMDAGFEGGELDTPEASPDPPSDFPSPEPLEPGREAQGQLGRPRPHHGFQFPFNEMPVTPEEEKTEIGSTEDVSP